MGQKAANLSLPLIGQHEVLFGVFEARRKANRLEQTSCADDDGAKKVAATVIRGVGFAPVAPHESNIMPIAILQAGEIIGLPPVNSVLQQDAERPVYPTWIRSSRVVVFWLVTVGIVVLAAVVALFWLPGLAFAL